MYKDKRLSIIKFAVVFLVAAVHFGCSSKFWHSEERRKFLLENDALIAPYFTGDISLSRTALKKVIQQTENALPNILEPLYQAEFLELNYERLYTLEKRDHNDLQAEAVLIKARYWRLRALEMNNHLDQDAVNILRLDTSEKIFERVDKFDKGAKDGDLPEYIKNIRGDGANSKQM